MSTKKKQAPKKTKSRSEDGVSRRSHQQPLPGIDTDEFRGFLDLSSGMPTKACCPKCGYRW